MTEPTDAAERPADAVPAGDAAAAAPEPADDWEAVAAQRAEREKRRLRQTVRDMVLSMVVVTGAVLFLVAPWNWNTPDPVKEVDPAPVISGAAQQIEWPVLAPTLPAGWRATSARIETADDGQPVVVLGYLSPDTEFVGLQQSDTRITDFVKDTTLDGRPAGDATLGGATWQRYVNADETRRSLVRKEGDVTYVVSGTGPWAEVEGFTATLKPA